MGLFNKLFSKTQVNQVTDGFFSTLTAYQPRFTSFRGGIYEAELVRACIDRFATHCSKLKPEVLGQNNSELQKLFRFKPNPFMDTTKFLYKLATILETENNAFIIPIYDVRGRITGVYPISPRMVELVESKGEPFIKYRFDNGETATVELERVGILNKFFNKDDFFGDNNDALRSTIDLIHAQNQAITESAKQNAVIRFIAKIGSALRNEDLVKEQQAFRDNNLSMANNGGAILVDSKYTDVTQIESKGYMVPKSQIDMIRDNVFFYFGTNEKILKNEFDENVWSAYYEGKIEPFAIQLSLVLTNMLFTDKEKSYGNEVMFTANRLQYAKTETKLQVVVQMFDRGFMTHNQGLEIFNLPPTEDGDRLFIRREYIEVDKLEKEEEPNDNE